MPVSGEQTEQVERVYVACDVSNLWRSCKEHYGSEARIDFQVLSRVVQAHRYPLSIRQSLFAYIVTNPRQKHHAFYAALRGYGYAVKERFMRFDKSANRPTRTDWDVGITIDAMRHMDFYDTFVLISGDGDFAPLIRHLKSQKKRTIAVTFEHSASRSLFEAADDIILLGEDAVYVS